MTMLRRALPIEVEVLGDRQVRITMSTGGRARDGHILEPAGCVLDNYRANPIQLWFHNPDHPIGTNDEIAVQGDKITARNTFAPSGVSVKADEICGLVKSGVIRTVSVGFNILEAEPIDPARPRAGLHVTRWELVECSYCAVPVDTDAVVTARAAADWKVGAAKSLPIEDSDDWDGPAAEASIFEYAGGDDFEPAKARKGFLVYDAAKPKLRGSYKLPIAHAVDGELKVPKGAIRAAASRLPQTDIPDDVMKSAGEILDHYKEKAGMAKDDEIGRALAPWAKRALTTRTVADAGLSKRGLYACAQLAYCLSQLGYLQQDGVCEASIEQDDSDVPAMLGQAAKALGIALIAMTKEEVTELLNGCDVDIAADDDALPAVERAYLAAAKTRQNRAWRAGIVMARAGKVLSKASAAKVDQAAGHLDKASANLGTASDSSGTMGEHAEALTDLHQRAADTHDKMTAALEAANGSAPADVTKQLAKVQQHHKALGKHIDNIGERAAAIGDVQGETQGAIDGATRCMRSAVRCVRSLLDANGDTDPKDVQTSDGLGESDGTENDRAWSVDFRRRQAELLALRAA